MLFDDKPLPCPESLLEKEIDYINIEQVILPKKFVQYYIKGSTRSQAEPYDLALLKISSDTHVNMKEKIASLVKNNSTLLDREPPEITISYTAAGYPGYLYGCGMMDIPLKDIVIKDRLMSYQTPLFQRIKWFSKFRN